MTEVTEVKRTRITLSFLSASAWGTDSRALEGEKVAIIVDNSERVKGLSRFPWDIARLQGFECQDLHDHRPLRTRSEGQVWFGGTLVANFRRFDQRRSGAVHSNHQAEHRTKS